MIGDTLSSQNTDTLSLLQQKQISPAKADSDSLQLADLHAVQEVDSGFEGTPISYSPRTDDAIALTLLACFFLSSIVLARGKKFLSQQVKDFVLHRERTSIFDSSTAADVRYLLVLVLQTCVLSGITFRNYFHDTSPTLMNQVSPLLLLGIYVGFCLAYFLLKWLIYMFLGWTFFDKNKTNIWLESYSALIYYVGFALFPFVLFLVYFDLSLTNLVIIGSIILIFTKILMFYKWIKLFFHQFSGLFLLILYFCALEIVPCLLLYQVLVSQPKPASEKSPYYDIAEKYGVKIDFRPFIKVESLSAKEFRQQKISILDHTAVIFTSRHAIDHFFTLCTELRVTIPETMKYFCVTEAVALYIQKYVQYRKRKIFFGATGKIEDLIPSIVKHKTEKYLVPMSDVHNDDVKNLLDKNNIQHTEAVMYRTVSNDFTPDEEFDYDMLVFFSPAGVTSLKKNFPDFNQREIKIGTFGSTTAQAVRDAGLRLDLEAPTVQAPSMTAALDMFIRENNK